MMQSNCVKNNNTLSHQACASCKHQRKKCNEDCILSPHFPAQRTREFQAVHKVFGVSNVQKMVRSVREDDRTKVAESLTWEALWRQKDPVLGPYGEYRRIYEELKLYKSFVHHQSMVGSWQNGNNNNNNNNNSKPGLLVDITNGLSGGLISRVNDTVEVSGGGGGGDSGDLIGGWEKLKQEQRQGYAMMNNGLIKQQYYLSDINLN